MISTIRFFIDPFTIFWILLLTTAILRLFKYRQAYKWVGSFALIWFLIISTPALPTILINTLEDQYEPIDLAEMADKELPYQIIILGAGHGFDDRLPSNSLLSQNALARLTEGMRLHRHLPNSKLILSGYSSSGRTTQAEILQQTAILLGAEITDTILQPKPSNTYEEAAVFAEYYDGQSPVILVTSAAHMPRALSSFRAMDISVIPSPTNYRLKGSWKHKYFGWPSLQNIENLQSVVNEYAALLWYNSYHFKSIFKK